METFSIENQVTFIWIFYNCKNLFLIVKKLFLILLIVEKMFLFVKLIQTLPIQLFWVYKIQLYLRLQSLVTLFSLLFLAFGFLVPSSQKDPILGVIFDTCSFPQVLNFIINVIIIYRMFNCIIFCLRQSFIWLQKGSSFWKKLRPLQILTNNLSEASLNPTILN